MDLLLSVILSVICLALPILLALSVQYYAFNASAFNPYTTPKEDRLPRFALWRFAWRLAIPVTLGYFYESAAKLRKLVQRMHSNKLSDEDQAQFQGSYEDNRTALAEEYADGYESVLPIMLAQFVYLSVAVSLIIHLIRNQGDFFSWLESLLQNFSTEVIGALLTYLLLTKFVETLRKELDSVRQSRTKPDDAPMQRPPKE